MFADGWEMRPNISVEEVAILMLSFNPSDTKLNDLKKQFNGEYYGHALAAVDTLCDACLRGEISYTLRKKIVFNEQAQKFQTVDEPLSLDDDMRANADNIIVKLVEVAKYFKRINMRNDVFFARRSDVIIERFDSNNTEETINPQTETVPMSMPLTIANYVFSELKNDNSILSNAKNPRDAIIKCLDAYNQNANDEGKKMLSENMIKAIATVVNWAPQGGAPTRRNK